MPYSQSTVRNMDNVKLHLYFSRNIKLPQQMAATHIAASL
jgi:hypothetical protein